MGPRRPQLAKGRLPSLGSVPMFHAAAHASLASRGLEGLGGAEGGDVSQMRREFSAEGLEEAAMPAAPLAFFRTWFDEAVRAEVHEPNAMCLSTVSSGTGRPSARIVLLKGFDERGFVWYTNYGSRKAQELDCTPFASLTFWWGPLDRCVRVEGRVARVPQEESEAYFRSRPRSSQLGALVSEQSRPVEPGVLDMRMETLRQQYMPDGVAEADLPEVPMPDWGGYRLEPDVVEFWKGRPSRVHDRLVYTRPLDGAQSEWKKERLQP